MSMSRLRSGVSLFRLLGSLLYMFDLFVLINRTTDHSIAIIE
jgi:hypothetical protein